MADVSWEVLLREFRGFRDDLAELKIGYAEVRTELRMGTDRTINRLDQLNGSVARHSEWISSHRDVHTEAESFAKGRAQAVITKGQLAALGTIGTAAFTIAGGLIAVLTRGI